MVELSAKIKVEGTKLLIEFDFDNKEWAEHYRKQLHPWVSAKTLEILDTLRDFKLKT